ncbi:MAG TPA: NAD(P)H-hydrate dehydratase, partial [Dissulfurispiraceae bacterium]|nr:NAD(P)H-hydrate dehydratase [Dissulfurispiraceae bacterium]
MTVTFGLPKRGHLLYPGAEYTGKLFVEDIGFPRELLESDSIPVEEVTPASFGAIPTRRKNAFKGDYGHIFVIAGSRGKTGAAVMTAKSCLRSGAGLVTIGIPSSLVDAFQARVTEEMTLPLPDDGTGMLSPEALDVILDFITRKIDVIAIGPGIGISEATREIVAELVLRSPVPLVIDADGLNSLQGRGQNLEDAKSPLILTPHPGEMRRLLGKEEMTVAGIERDRIGIALQFAAETGTYLVLKGVPTVTATPEGRAFLNSSGNPGMASAGSGDVLTGIIASLLGQGVSPEQSAILGVYLHGLAGDFASADKGEPSLIASDIIDHLPHAIRSVMDGQAGVPWKTT